MEEGIKKEEEKNNLELKLEEAFKKVIMNTTIELMGESLVIEKKMKKSLV